MMTNQVFFIPKPKPGDTRERNAFGILKGFGKASERYYETQDAREVCNEQAVNQEIRPEEEAGRGADSTLLLSYQLRTKRRRIEMHHTYQKSFATSAFHVVHRAANGDLGSTVAGSNDEEMAKQDALTRNQSARELLLDCSYVVLPRGDGKQAIVPSLPVADAIDAAAPI